MESLESARSRIRIPGIHDISKRIEEANKKMSRRRGTSTVVSSAPRGVRFEAGDQSKTIREMSRSRSKLVDSRVRTLNRNHDPRLEHEAMNSESRMMETDERTTQ